MKFLKHKQMNINILLISKKQFINNNFLTI